MSKEGIISKKKVDAINEYFKAVSLKEIYAQKNYKGYYGPKCEWCARFKEAGLYHCFNCNATLREYEEEEASK